MKHREFVYDSESQEGSDLYLKLMDKYDFDLTNAISVEELDEVETSLLRIIKKHPDFFPAYKELHEFYAQFEDDHKEEAKYLELSYKMALDIVRGKTNEWPLKMSWYFIENRPVIRALIGGAISRWEQGKTDEAADVFRNLLKTNYNDNPGVRFLLLAIREGMTFQQYEKRFSIGDLMDNKVLVWYRTHWKNYPEEFKFREDLIDQLE